MPIQAERSRASAKTAAGQDKTRSGRATLVTTFYADPEPARRAELVECLRRNAANEHIVEIHVFLEDGVAPELEHEKLRLVEHWRRVTYRDLFDFANEQLPRRRVAIANADIYFDETLGRLEGYDLAGRLLCLSRWNVTPEGIAYLFEHPASQDAWIFETPLRTFPCEFHLGVPGCDNRLAWRRTQL